MAATFPDLRERHGKAAVKPAIPATGMSKKQLKPVPRTQQVPSRSFATENRGKAKLR